MKIALVNTFIPFLRGGAEVLVDDLFHQLSLSGHQVTLFRVPFPTDYEIDLTELVIAMKLLDLTAYDRVITFKFPGYCVCHPNRSLWLFHQFRQVYDLYGKENGFEANARTDAIRSIVQTLDNQELREIKNCTVIGTEVRDRLKRFNGIDAEVICPPLPNAESYYSSQASNYIYYPSRVTRLKRQHLAIEAMRYVQSGVRLILTGRCGEPDYEDELNRLISENRLENRVQYQNLWLGEDEKLKLISESLGLLFIPFHEDYGYVTLEAYYAAKPLITCTDAGSPVGFVEEGKTGYIAQPTPQDIAEKMDLLYLDRQKAAEMGRNARAEILRRNITWDETVRKLLL